MEQAQRLGGGEEFWYSSALTLADTLLAIGGDGGEVEVGPGAVGGGAWPGLRGREPHADVSALSSSGLPVVSKTHRYLQGPAEGKT